MATTEWPKWEGGPTLIDYAAQQLGYGDNVPFDEPLAREAADSPMATPADWATRAARGIAAQLSEHRPSFNDASHPEKIAQGDLVEIIEVMAAIMRAALMGDAGHGQ